MAPTSLRNWFVAHAIIDVIIATPLLVTPTWVLGLLGWTTIDPFMTRLVAAALFGIGITSYVVREKPSEVYDALLILKLIWAGAAMIGIVWTMLSTETPLWGWVALIGFAIFFIVWAYFKGRMKGH